MRFALGRKRDDPSCSASPPRMFRGRTRLRVAPPAAPSCVHFSFGIGPCSPNAPNACKSADCCTHCCFAPRRRRWWAGFLHSSFRSQTAGRRHSRLGQLDIVLAALRTDRSTSNITPCTCRRMKQLASLLQPQPPVVCLPLSSVCLAVFSSEWMCDCVGVTVCLSVCLVGWSGGRGVRAGTVACRWGASRRCALLVTSP